MNNHIDQRGRQRRMLLGGVSGAIATALFATACKPSQEQELEVEAVADVGPEIAPAPPAPDPTIADLTIPPGIEPATVDELAWGQQFLRQQLSIDLHCHPGIFFFEGMTPEDPTIRKMASSGVFMERTVADMAAGQLSAAMFSTVADVDLLGANERGLYARREYEPGEAYQSYLRQMAVLQNMVDADLVAPVRSVSDLLAAKQAAKVGAIFTCEGGDFLEEKGERLAEAWEAGVRSIQLVHYHVNQLGDIQTEAPKHKGLSEFGRETVAEMNRLGMLIDLAHATFATTRDVAEITSQPIMVSHSYVADEGAQHPRLLSEDHARLVAETGGLVGAWPTGIGNPDFPSFIRRLLTLVDLIGIDHVALGTDMDANHLPVFSNYRQLPYIPIALKRHGMNDEEMIKVLGGNFMRVFANVTRDTGHTS